MVAGFHSFHWRHCELGEPELAAAHDELADPTGEGAYLRAFRTLLHSGHPAAAGIALDHFQYSGALTRFGGESAVARFEDQVLAVARELLRQPPALVDDGDFAGAHHASALNAMMNLAEESDVGLIADALESATEGNVRSTGCTAAGQALARCAGPSPRLVGVLGALAFDEGLDVQERAEALSALDEAKGAQATALLVRATDSDEVEIQAEGAAGLMRPDRFAAHRERVERLVTGWPDDVGHKARMMLDDRGWFHSTHWIGAELSDPELHRAHAQLRLPVGKRATRRAFRTLLHSGRTVAVGIALDHFVRTERLRGSRDAGEIARAVLRHPPSPAGLSPRTGAAANHLSALAAIQHAGVRPSDADLIVEVLERATVRRVRSVALSTAGHVLRAMDRPDPRLVDVIGRFVYESGLRAHRKSALHVLSQSLGAEADPLLIRAVRSEDRDLQVDAAWELSRPERIERHRALLEDLVESWPPGMKVSRGNPDWVGQAVFGGMHSAHWKGSRLSDPGLYRAHRELRAAGDAEAAHRALRTLLRSGQPAAVGIALDHWWCPGGIERLGGADARTAVAAEALAAAREALRSPPSPSASSPQYGADAGHLSALHVLRVARCPGPEDAAALAAALERPMSEGVGEVALHAVELALEEGRSADPLLVRTLGALARDESRSPADRVAALYALRDVPGDAATQELVRATACDALEVQVAAAHNLTEEHRSAVPRDLLVRLVAQWPEEGAPGAADLVREHLADLVDLQDLEGE
ncbi:hypothetical protein ACIRPT_02140 [Streptomyces sp. NPDC101227]|uniref:hypothetical protein n=1 Tax=Streptomyces sp. NPDC101227 TaxID=3366136 RepID=UPI00381976A4